MPYHLSDLSSNPEITNFPLKTLQLSIPDHYVHSLNAEALPKLLSMRKGALIRGDVPMSKLLVNQLDIRWMDWAYPRMQASRESFCGIPRSQSEKSFNMLTCRGILWT